MRALGAGRTVLSLALVAGVAGGVSALRARLNRRYGAARRILDVAQIPRPLAARVASLGHTEWATDVLWINALIYYGQSLYANLPARYIRQYADTMIELDPRFKRAYPWAATALLYRTVRSTEDDARRAGDYLRQGLAQFPNDPALHHAYGLNLAFDQAPYKRHGSPEWVALKVEGGQHLARAAFGLSATTERSPWLPLTAAGLLMIGRREREGPGRRGGGAYSSGWLISRVVWPAVIDTLKFARELSSLFTQLTRCVPAGTLRKMNGVLCATPATVQVEAGEVESASMPVPPPPEGAGVGVVSRGVGAVSRGVVRGVWVRVKATRGVCVRGAGSRRAGSVAVVGGAGTATGGDG